MFLPEGYPHSVSKDYMSFQMYDTMQGFVGYVQGQLLVLCYLTALGIGNQEASVMSAMYVWIFKDTTGVLVGLCSGIPFITSIFALRTTIPFWKMVAEVIRMCTGVLDIYASLQPSYTFLILSCVSTAFNTVAGIMEQQTRATLMSHFAIQNNFADCAAKESNQDRGVKVFGIPLAFFWLQKIQANKSYLLLGYIFLALSKVVLTYLAVGSLDLHKETATCEKQPTREKEESVRGRSRSKNRGSGNGDYRNRGKSAKRTKAR